MWLDREATDGVWGKVCTQLCNCDHIRQNGTLMYGVGQNLSSTSYIVHVYDFLSKTPGLVKILLNTVYLKAYVFKVSLSRRNY